MKLIIGGAYQGKTCYAKEKYNLTEDDIHICNGTEIDFSKKCIDNLEQFTCYCVKNDIEPVEYFKQHREQWQNSIIISRDIFCGVVPMGADNRRWRQQTGRLCQYLSQEAESVVRIFCGLEQKLK
ncbi:MAG: cobalamin biosynthesis protein CobU [Ruminococcaceae bacterium]|nr:cobalamin biosynthesis protein CobU [Oscillospiraceae bacterium]